MKNKIAFDVHGVLDTHLRELKPMIRMLDILGYEIHIISGPSKVQIMKRLKNFGYNEDNFFIYPSSRVHSVVNFLEEDGVKFEYKDGNPWTDEQTWWTSKARICKSFDIDYLVDDSLQYKPAFELTKCEYIHIDELLWHKKVI